MAKNDEFVGASMVSGETSVASEERGSASGPDLIEHARAQEALQAELERSRVLHEVSTAFIQAENVEVLYQKLLDGAVAVLHADFGSLQVLHAQAGQGGELRLLGYRGFSARAASFWERVSPDSASACGAALRTKQRVFVPDVRQCPFMAGSEDLATYLETGIIAVQTTPLVSRSGEVLGMISTHWRAVHEPTPGELRALDVLARQAADLLECKRAEAELRAARGRLEAELQAAVRLRDLSTQLINGGGDKGLYEQMLETAMAIMGADFASLQRVEETAGGNGRTLKLLAWRNFAPESARFWQRVGVGSATPCGAALCQGQRCIIADVEQCAFMAGTADLEEFRRSGIRAVQSTPLISRAGRFLGMISTHWRQRHEPGERELAVLDVLARQIADLVERRNQEERLQQSEERYRSLFEHMLEGFVYCRMFYDHGVPQDFLFLDVNGAFERLTGLKQVVGRKVSEVIPGIHQSSPEFLQIYGRVALSGQPERFETYVESLDSWFSISVFSPQPEHFVVVFDNITARKRAEAALRSSEEKYRLLFESLDEGFCVIEVLFDSQDRAQDYRFLEVNPAFVKQTGLVEAVGKTARQLVPELDAHWFEIFGRIARTGEPLRFEDSAVALGRYYDVFAFRIGQPHEHKVAVLFQDILERKRAEAALEQTRTMLMDGERLAHLGTWQWSAETGETVWSEEEFRLYGLEPGPHSPSYEELLSQHFHPEDAATLDRAFREAIQSGSLLENDHRIVRPDGTVRFLHNRAHPQFDPAGKLTGYVGATLDITERKAFEAELQRLVEERTARLQELVGELEHFSYTITHDLKSPLRAMRGYAEMAALALRGAEGTRAKELLGRIATAAERMDRLIADALNYSRSVRQELLLENVDAGALLRGMLDSYPEFQPNQAQIRVEGRLPVVRANEAGLTQCFSNLLGNAVKFVKPGEKPDIRVWAAEREDWVRIWVEDKGIGISSDMLPRVFDMFSRGSKNYEGTGIGLALVRKVAQRMGGQAGVESAEGHGSRFWIELKSGERRPALAEVRPGPGEAPGAGTVLYVEDEESDAMFMQVAFEGKGLAGKLQLVGTGRAAIDYLSGSGEFGDREQYPVPALVLLDLNLPQVSGFGVLEWMRNNPDYQRTPVVVFSSSTREDDQAKAKRLGADEFVAKPNSGLKFGEVVAGLRERWLGRRRGAKTAG